MVACTEADVAYHKGRAAWHLGAASLEELDEQEQAAKDNKLIKEAVPHFEKALEHFKTCRQSIDRLQQLAKPIKNNEAFLRSMEDAAKTLDTIIEHTNSQVKQLSGGKLAALSGCAELGVAFAKMDERMAQNAKRHAEEKKAPGKNEEGAAQGNTESSAVNTGQRCCEPENDDVLTQESTQLPPVYTTLTRVTGPDERIAARAVRFSLGLVSAGGILGFIAYGWKRRKRTV